MARTHAGYRRDHPRGLCAAGVHVFCAPQWKPATGAAAGAARLSLRLHRRRTARPEACWQRWRNGGNGVIAALCLALLLIMFAAQRLTYPASSHVEWPGLTPRNPWQQAFLWIRANTPEDAIFALDNDYIEWPGEDAQGFRATAERSAVADYFKDGGIASNFRLAAIPWWQGSQATSSSTAPPMSSGWPGFGPLASPGSFCRRRQTPAFRVHLPMRVCASAGSATLCFTPQKAQNSRGRVVITGGAASRC